MQAFENQRWASHVQTPMFRHRAAVRLVQQEPVLDVGAGDGLFLKMLERAGFDDVRGIDLSPVAVQNARAAGLDVRQADITEGLPFEDGQFGTVCALDVLEHLTNPSGLLQELARVAHTVVVAVPNFLHWRQRFQMLFGAVPFQCRPGRGHVYWFSEGILVDMASDAGLIQQRMVREPAVRLGAVGAYLADARPSLFAVSVAARFASVAR